MLKKRTTKSRGASLVEKILVALFIVSMLTNTTLASAAVDVSQTRVEASELLALSSYIAINEEGLFVLDRNGVSSSPDVSKAMIEWVSQDLSRINGYLRELPREERPYVVETKEYGVQIAWSMYDIPQSANYITGCVHVPRWVLDVVGWTAIVYGAGLVTVGLFAQGTIVGIPVGALLQAVGLWDGVAGTFFLWVVSEFYPDGIWVCW